MKVSKESLKILIVEDESVSAKFLQNMLNMSSLNISKIESAASLNAASRILDKDYFDVMLLDLNLPDSMGLDTIVKMNKRYPGTAIIAITVVDEEVLGLKAVASGAEEYLVKGRYDIDLLVRSIYYAIERKKLDNERRKTEKALEAAYEQLQTSQLQLIQSEKLAAVGQLAAGAAHEINNPLFVIAGRTEMLLEEKKYNVEETRNSLKAIFEQSKRIRVIVDRLLEFSRKEKYEQKVIDINRALEAAVNLLSYQIKTENIKMTLKLDPHSPQATGNFGQLQEVFLNIMLNAAQAMKEKGTLTISTRQERISEHRKRATDKFKPGQKIVVIEFEDTGPGMDEQTINRIFLPFFSTKEEGTGLGLYISYSIIENHQGTIEAQSQAQKGSTFIVKLSVPK